MRPKFFGTKFFVLFCFAFFLFGRNIFFDLSFFFFGPNCKLQIIIYRTKQVIQKKIHLLTYSVFGLYGFTTLLTDITIYSRQNVMTDISAIIILPVMLNNSYCYIFVFTLSFSIYVETFKPFFIFW